MKVRRNMYFIEVMVIVAIIGLLATFIIPGVMVVRAKGGVALKAKAGRSQYSYVVEIDDRVKVLTYLCDQCEVKDGMYVLTDSSDRLVAKVGVKAGDRFVMRPNPEFLERGRR